MPKPKPTFRLTSAALRQAETTGANPFIGGIVLAGGASRRFGGDKRLATLANGVTLIERSIANASTHLPELIVALRVDDTELARRLSRPGVSCVCAPESALGMAHTMSAAFAAIPPHWHAAMVLLADMPFIHTQTYNQLTSAWQRAAADDPIVIPVHDGKPGHPVTFARRWFGAIQALRGDEGARSVVKGHPRHVLRVAVDDPGVMQDIDTREALGAASKKRD